MPFRTWCSGRLLGFLLVATPVVVQAQPSFKLMAQWGEGPTYAVEATGDRLYYGRGGYLVVVDLAHALQPRELGRVLLPGVVQDVRVSRGHAFVASGPGGFHVVDVNDARRPELVATVQAPAEDEWGAVHFVDGATQVEVAADTVYVVFAGRWPYGGDVLYAVEIYDPRVPALYRRAYPEEDSVSYQIADLYVYDGQPLVTGRDVSHVYNPQYPKSRSAIDRVCQGTLVARSGYMFCVDHTAGPLVDSLEVFELSDLDHPAPVAQAAPADGHEAWTFPREMVVEDGFAYVVSKGPDGPDIDQNLGFLAVYDVRDVASPIGVASTAIGDDPVDVAVHGDVAYVAASGGGLAVVDVTDRSAPAVAATLPAVEDMQVVGVREDVAILFERQRTKAHFVEASGETPVPRAEFEFSGEIVDAAVAGQYLVAVTSDSMLQVVDVQDPAAPRLMESVRAVPGLMAAGSGAVFVVNGNTVRIFDLADPDEPDLSATYESSAAILGNVVRGRYLYLATQPACAPSSSCAALEVVDVGTLEDPVVRGTLPLSGRYAGHTVTDVDGSEYVVAATRRTVGPSEPGLGVDVVDVTHPDELVMRGRHERPLTALRNGVGVATLPDGTIALSTAPNPFFVPPPESMLWRFALGGQAGGSWSEPTSHPGTATGVVAVGDRVYVTTEERGLFVYSMTTTTAANIPQTPSDRRTEAYPNPFAAQARFAYTLARPQHVRLHVYDVTGRRVATLADGWQQAGEHVAVFEAEGLASGVYVYQLETGEGVTSGKMLLVR